MTAIERIHNEIKSLEKQIADSRLTARKGNLVARIDRVSWMARVSALQEVLVWIEAERNRQEVR